ncbi:MAG: hypothetical protein WBK51_12470 [Polaromonas sp.]
MNAAARAFEQQMNTLIWTMSISMIIGIVIAYWVIFLIVKKGISKGIQESGLLESIDRIADWQPKDKNTFR